MTPRLVVCTAGRGGCGFLGGGWSELSFGHVAFVLVIGHSSGHVEEAARCTKSGSQRNTLCGNINLIVLNVKAENVTL